MSQSVEAHLRRAAQPVDRIWQSYKQSGELASRNQLVEAYMSQVRHIASRMASRLVDHVDVQDLIQSGVFGLIDAIERFDPERGFRFETFCRRRIEGAMLDHIRSCDWVPRLVRQRTASLDRARERLFATSGTVPTDRELAEHLQLSRADFERISRDGTAVQMVSYDAPVGRGPEGEARPLDGHEDVREVDVLEAIGQRELLQRIRGLLTRRERLVLLLYYHERLTLREIGRVLDLTESRVCQIRGALLKRLAAHFQASEARETASA